MDPSPAKTPEGAFLPSLLGGAGAGLRGLFSGTFRHSHKATRVANPRTCFSPLSSLAYQAFVSSLGCKFCDCRPGSVPHSGSSTQRSSMSRKDPFLSPPLLVKPRLYSGKSLYHPHLQDSLLPPLSTPHASLFPSPLGGTPEHPLEGRSRRKQHPSSTHGRLGESRVRGREAG